MAGNPNVPQGALNRVQGTVSFDSNPSLNITAPYLGADGISLALEGAAVEYFPTMTGAVLSEEPFLMATITIALLKTQALSDAYKSKWENDAALGDAVIRPDVTSGGLSPFDILNCSITGIREMRYNGREPTMMVTLRGYYEVNSALFN